MECGENMQQHSVGKYVAPNEYCSTYKRYSCP